METIPIEIIEKILICKELSIKDIVNLSLTCTKLQGAIYNNNKIWKAKYFQKWPHLRHKLDNDPVSFHDEVRHIYELKKRAMTILMKMPEKCYKKVELADSDMEIWDDIIAENWENVHYLTIHLLTLINTEGRIKGVDVAPLDAPGNLTIKYYAVKVLGYFRRISLSRMWHKFTSLPPERKLLEIGAIIVAQWCQPQLNIDSEDIPRNLDDIADMVKIALKQEHPDHPIFQTPKEVLQLWRNEIRPDNEWNIQDSDKICKAIKQVIYHQMHFVPYARGEYYQHAVDERYIFLNVVLKTRTGMTIPLAIIYEAVARRLGLRCEPVIFPNHFLLRFCDSQQPNANWYYIDLYTGEKIAKGGGCPYGRNIVEPRPKHPTATTEEVIIKLAYDLEHLARQSYSPSGQVFLLRSALELVQLLNPKDISSLVNLGRLYMVHNFNTAPIENFVRSQEFVHPEQARSIVQMLRSHRVVLPDDPIEPVYRTPEVKFAVGMVMHHLLYGYKCVIFNWDHVCSAAQDWQSRNNINKLIHKAKQPFYNVLVEDGSHRYVAQENMKPVFPPQPLVLDIEVGRYFSHFYQTHYVPNAQTEYHYPEDKIVRLHHLDGVRKLNQLE